MGRDYYEILGVGRNASKEDIKRAYRKLSKQYHPDRNADPSAEREFKRVQEAYNTLKDKEKRTQYDRYGAAGVGRVTTGPGGQRVYQWGGDASVSMDDLEDLFSAFGGGAEAPGVFEQFFGGARRPLRTRRAADQQGEIELSFEQAVHGATVDIRLRRESGATESLEVKIPPGVSSGQKIRIRGRVPSAAGGPPGDLLLTCKVRPHAYFRREGADIYLDVPVSVTEATLGAKVNVPSLDGTATVTIPPATASNTKLRLAGRGVATGEGRRGDLYVVVRIVPPKTMSDTQRALFERLSAIAEEDPRATCAWSKEVGV